MNTAIIVFEAIGWVLLAAGLTNQMHAFYKAYSYRPAAFTYLAGSFAFLIADTIAFLGDVKVTAGWLVILALFMLTLTEVAEHRNKRDAQDPA